MVRLRSDIERESRRSRYVLYAIPLIVIILSAVVYVVLTLPAPTASSAMDFTFSLVIQESNNNGSSIAGIVPANAIGEAGGYWRTSQFNAYGVDVGHYPIYMDRPCAISNATACLASGGCQAANGTIVPPCTIHVKSTRVINYTLGDFFDVWGYPVGANNTLGVLSKNNFVWQLCIGANAANAKYSNLWRAQPLLADEAITLFYVNPSNSNTPGCAGA
jgi:hypothetical protein